MNKHPQVTHACTPARQKHTPTHERTHTHARSRALVIFGPIIADSPIKPHYMYLYTTTHMNKLEKCCKMNIIAPWVRQCQSSVWFISPVVLHTKRFLRWHTQYHKKHKRTNTDWYIRTSNGVVNKDEILHGPEQN